MNHTVKREDAPENVIPPRGRFYLVVEGTEEEPTTMTQVAGDAADTET